MVLSSLTNRTLTPTPCCRRAAVAMPAGRHVSASVVSKMPLLDIWHSPEVDAVLDGIALALHAHMSSVPPERLLAGHRLHPPQYERFSEVLYPLESDVDKRSLEHVPSVASVRAFIGLLHRQLDIDVSILIMTLIYVERVLELNAWPLLPHTWRRMLLAGLLAAAKVLFDELVWNCDLTEAFPDWSLADINELELFFCSSMQFSFHVRSSTYASFYFCLNSLNYEKRRSQDEREPSAGAQAAREAVALSIGSRIELKSIEHDAQHHSSPHSQAQAAPGDGPRVERASAVHVPSNAQGHKISLLVGGPTVLQTPLALVRRLGSFP